MALIHLCPRSQAPLEPSTVEALKSRIASSDKDTRSHGLWYQEIEDPTNFYFFQFAVAGDKPDKTSNTPELQPGSDIISTLTKEFDFVAETIIFSPSSTHIQAAGFPSFSPVVAIGHCHIAAPDTQAFQQTFDEVVHVLEDFTDQPVGRAWVDGKPEFFMFSGWESVEQHVKEFAESEGFKRDWVRLRGVVEGFGVKHARKV